MVLTVKLVPLLACTLITAATAATYPLTIKHFSGETTLRKPPARTVALGPHALDLLLSLGVQPVGYGEAAQLSVNNYGSPIRQIRYLGSRVKGTPVNVGDRFKPNLEVVASLKPDLIVGENYASDSYTALNKIAPTVLLHGIHSGDWQKNIVTLAQALNREGQAKAVIARHARILAGARTAIPAQLRGKKALVVWNAGGASRDLYTILGPKDWTGGFFETLGFKLELPARRDTTLTDGYAQISSEALSSLNPDAVFVIASSKNTVAQAARDWKANALAQTLRASRQGHVYFLDVQLFSRIRGPIAEELMVQELLRQLR